MHSFSPVHFKYPTNVLFFRSNIQVLSLAVFSGGKMNLSAFYTFQKYFCASTHVSEVESSFSYSSFSSNNQEQSNILILSIRHKADNQEEWRILLSLSWYLASISGLKKQLLGFHEDFHRTLNQSLWESLETKMPSLGKVGFGVACHNLSDGGRSW